MLWLYRDHRVFTLAVQFNGSYGISVPLLPDKFISRRIESKNITNNTLLKYLDSQHIY